MLSVDGAFGEGGGQMLRTAVTLAAVLGRPVRIYNIRVKRANSGLAAQHLTAVRAAAMICDAELYGDVLGSTELTFIPHSSPVAGLYEFDVSQAREGGSAGSAILVLQTILLPLALAAGPSTITVRGGTHVPWSPSFHYFRDVYLPALAQLGLRVEAQLLGWGWFPAGSGEVRVELPGENSLNAPPDWSVRGDLDRIAGIAVSSSLPAHIAQRICNRAVNLLDQHNLANAIQPKRVRSASPGAGIFLSAQYESISAGVGVLGKKGKPSEQVAQEAVELLLAFHNSNAVVDRYLADQLVLPLALLQQPVQLSVERISQHAQTNLWVIEQFLGLLAELHYDPPRIQLWM